MGELAIRERQADIRAHETALSEIASAEEQGLANPAAAAQQHPPTI
jgi:hypothetical protein